MPVSCWRLDIGCLLIAECMQACLVLHAKAVGGNGKGWRREGAGKGRGGKSWLGVQCERFDGEGTPATGPVGIDAVPEERRAPVMDRARKAGLDAPGRAGVFSRAPEDDVSEEDTGEATASVSAGTVHATALRAHRMVEGRRAWGFEPQRNTLYILGRPVQVFSRSNKTTFIICQSRVMFTSCVAHFQTSIS